VMPAEIESATIQVKTDRAVNVVACSSQGMIGGGATIGQSCSLLLVCDVSNG
jgi:hypothetical protein